MSLSCQFISKVGLKVGKEYLQTFLEPNRPCVTSSQGLKSGRGSTQSTGHRKHARTLVLSTIRTISNIATPEPRHPADSCFFFAKTVRFIGFCRRPLTVLHWSQARKRSGEKLLTVLPCTFPFTCCSSCHWALDDL